MEVTSYGVDYSFDRPNINCLWQNGFKFAARYTSNGNSSKNATKPEVDALIARGFQVVIVHETHAGDMLQGYNRGKHDAQIAHEKTRDLGMPRDRPIYFACDVDITSSSQMNACKQYLNGCADVIGRNRVGVYGEYDVIEDLLPDYGKWGWQTYAWSRGRISDEAHFRQYKNGVQLCGGTVDLNEAYTEDFGQWPLRVAAPTPEPEPEEDEAVIYKNDEGHAVFVAGPVVHTLTLTDYRKYVERGVNVVRAEDGLFSDLIKARTR